MRTKTRGVPPNRLSCSRCVRWRQSVSDRAAAPLRPLGSPWAPAAAAALAAATSPAVRAGEHAHEPAAHPRGAPSGGVWHTGGSGAGLGGLRLAAHYVGGRAAPWEPAAAGGGHGTAQRHAV